VITILLSLVHGHVFAAQGNFLKYLLIKNYYHRPNMTLTEVSSGRVVGSVVDPFTCCNPYYEVKDAEQVVKYRVYGACCQKGFCCCSDVFFFIYPGGDSDMKEENAIGTITKKWTDCVKETYTNANNFLTVFPKDANADEKLLLIGVTLLIDYTIFEREKNQGGGA
jgi:hypothetical protein